MKKIRNLTIKIAHDEDDDDDDDGDDDTMDQMP